jgi:hypothetical protein
VFSSIIDPDPFGGTRIHAVIQPIIVSSGQTGGGLIEEGFAGTYQGVYGTANTIASAGALQDVFSAGGERY